jgi:hypothetical protein
VQERAGNKLELINTLGIVNDFLNRIQMAKRKGLTDAIT